MLRSSIAPDEPQVMARAIKIAESGDYNPRWFNYPSLVIYLQSAVVRLVHAAFDVPLRPGAKLLFEGAPAAALPHYFFGRGLTLLLAVGTTALTMSITRRLAGTWLALLAGATFVASSLVLRSAVFVTVDMALTFFVTLSVFLLMRTLDVAPSQRDLRRFVLVVIGASLAAGAKYNGALIVVVIAGTFLARRGLGKRAWIELSMLAVLSIAVFFATTPFALLDSERIFSVGIMGSRRRVLHYRSGHLGADLGSSGEKALSTLFRLIGPFTLFALVPVAFSGAAGSIEVRAQVRILVGWVIALGAPVISPRCTSSVIACRSCLR